MRHHPSTGSREGWNIHCGRQAAWWVTALLLLTSCGGSPTPLKPLPDLHLPHITQVPGIRSHEASGSVHGLIRAVLTYVSLAAPAAARAAILLDGQWFDVGLDGSGFHSLTGCDGNLAISPDGQMVACTQASGVAAGVRVVSLSTAQQVQYATFTNAGQVKGASWLPDGRHLAIVTSLGGGCSIAVYALSQDMHALSLVGLLTFASFLLSPAFLGCSFDNVTWSPDGDWLAFQTRSANWEVYVLSVAAWLPALLHPASSLMTVAVTRDMLLAVGQTTYYAVPTWLRTPTGLSLTYASGAIGLRAVTFDLTTHATNVLFSLPEGEIDALSWTPDGKHLVFAQGTVQCTECDPPAYPSHLYVYTPSAAP